MLNADRRHEDRICYEIKRLNRTVEGLQDVLAEISLSDDEMFLKWELYKRDAAGRGTYMHWLFEGFLNRAFQPPPSIEFAMFEKIVNTITNETAWRTEWVIYADRERLAGSIDLVTRADDGALILYDWKRSKDLRRKVNNQFGINMLPPCDRLPDCAVWHYNLQLNLYKYMLENYYGERVSEMYIVCAHPDNHPDAFVSRVPVITSEVEQIMAELRIRARENNGMEANDIRLRDPMCSGGDTQQTSALDLSLIHI